MEGGRAPARHDRIHVRTFFGFPNVKAWIGRVVAARRRSIAVVAAARHSISPDLSIEIAMCTGARPPSSCTGRTSATEASTRRRMEARRIRRQCGAARLRAQPGDGMWTRSRRVRGILDVFYPGTSATLAQTAGISAHRR